MKILIAVSVLMIFLLLSCDEDLNRRLFPKKETIGHTHAWSSTFSTDTEADCVHSGEMSKHCSEVGCEERFEITTIPALGHDWENISGGRQCRRCGVKEINPGVGEGAIKPVYTPDLPIHGEVVVTDCGSYALIGYKPYENSLLNYKLVFCNVVGIGNLAKNEDGFFVLEYREGKGSYTIKLTVNGKDESVTFEKDFRRIS